MSRGEKSQDRVRIREYGVDLETTNVTRLIASLWPVVFTISAAY